MNNNHIDDLIKDYKDNNGKVCLELSEEVRKKKKAKVFRKKFRTKHTEKLKDFVGMNGTNKCHLRKIFSHKYRVILLGTSQDQASI